MAKATGKVVEVKDPFAGAATAGNLYALTGEYLKAQNQLLELDLDPQTIADTLEALEGDVAAKALRVVAIAQQFDAFASAIKEREKSLEARRKAAERKATELRAYVLEQLTAAGFAAGDKIRSPDLELRLQKNPAKVVIDNAELVPGFLRQIPTPPPEVMPPDLEAIKTYLSAELKEGEEPHVVAGAHLEQITRLVEK